MSIAAILLRPEVIMAISSATEVFVRDILRQVNDMSEEELTAFIAEQRERQKGHEEWLKQHQPE